LGLVLVTYGIKRKSTNILMGLSFLFLSHGILLAGLIDSGLIVHYPNLYRTGNLAGLIYAFLPFLYIQYTFFDKRFNWWHLMHLLPATLFFFDFLPVFLLDTENKRQLILSEVHDPLLVVSYTQSRLFPDNFYTGFRTIIINIYWAWSVLLVWKYRRRHPHMGSRKEAYRWIQTYLVIQLFMLLPFYFTLQSNDHNLVYKAVHFAAALIALSSGFFLLYFPRILYGFDFAQTNKVVPSEECLSTVARAPLNGLSAEMVKEIEMVLKMQLEEHKVFLRKGYTVHDLSRDSEIPHYRISSYLNQHLETTFPDFINKARIEYCFSLLKSGGAEKYTLAAIGEQCGFNNRNSFSTAFKKVTGKSPSSFLKEGVS
jgi:AraC-like DNA-binding protein